MNTLSIYIYLAGVINDLGNFLMFIAFVLITYTLITNIFISVINADEYFKKEKKKHVIWPIYVVILLGLIVVVIPDKRTMYAILASEAAGRVIETPQSQEIAQKLLKKIDGLLEDKKKD